MSTQPTPDTSGHPPLALSEPILAPDGFVATGKAGQSVESPSSTKIAPKTRTVVRTDTPHVHDDLGEMSLSNSTDSGGRSESRDLLRRALVKDPTVRNIDEEARHISLVKD